jgi:methionyl-tRNA formyltransferase
MNIYLSGQKYFAEEVLRLCLRLGHTVVGVCCPPGDKYVGALATRHGIPQTPAGSLCADTFPEGVDLGITAHSFDYVGRLTRHRPRLGWIGYHPSLLPRHRGRSAIEWAVRMRDAVTGGSVFWLNAGIDRGDIAAQDWRFIDPALFGIDPKKAAAKLWRDELQPLGVTLLERVLVDIAAGRIVREPQNPAFSTWEPSTEGRDVYRPDALLLPPHQEIQ